MRAEFIDLEGMTLSRAEALLCPAQRPNKYVRYPFVNTQKWAFENFFRVFRSGRIAHVLSRTSNSNKELSARDIQTSLNTNRTRPHWPAITTPGLYEIELLCLRKALTYIRYSLNTVFYVSLLIQVFDCRQPWKSP